MKAKYEVGQTVTIRTRKTGKVTGTIEAVQRIFKKVLSNGQFDRGGISTFENDIKGIALPYTFDGETLTINFPEYNYGTFVQKAYNQISKHYTYGYSIRIPSLGHRVLTDEKAIVKS